jgi:hypothetical protein
LFITRPSPAWHSASISSPFTALDAWHSCTDAQGAAQLRSAHSTTVLPTRQCNGGRVIRDLDFHGSILAYPGILRGGFNMPGRCLSASRLDVPS